MTAAIGEITINQLGPDGVVDRAVEQWVIKNPLITGMTMSDLDYSNEDLSEVTVNLVYDYAELKKLTQ